MLDEQRNCATQVSSMNCWHAAAAGAGSARSKNWQPGGKEVQTAALNALAQSVAC